MDEHNYEWRQARDRMIDLLTIGNTYPLRNLPVFRRSLAAVPYNNFTSVTIGSTQPGVEYTLRDSNGRTSEPHAGNRVEVQIESGDLTEEEHTFSVEARNKDSGLASTLIQTVTVQVGIDVDLAVSLAEQVIDYGGRAVVRIRDTQRNGKYQAFDPEENPLSEEVLSGEGGDLFIELQGLKENTLVRVKSTNLKTGLNGWLTQQVEVLVRPDLELAVSGDETPYDYDTEAKIVLSNTQSSVRYVLKYEWVDDDDEDYRESIYHTTPAELPGNGGVLDLLTVPLKEDLRLHILAVKADAPEGFPIEGSLTRKLTLRVKPDPSKALSLPEGELDPAKGTEIIVGDTQPGVKYQLLNDVNNAKIGWPRYHSRNKGVGAAGIGADFAVGRFEGNAVRLPTGPISKTKTFAVRAIKALTGVKTLLTQKIEVEGP